LSLAYGFFEGIQPWRCLAERLGLEGGNRFANSIRPFLGQSYSYEFGLNIGHRYALLRERSDWPLRRASDAQSPTRH
jgi:hypothetical protein